MNEVTPSPWSAKPATPDTRVRTTEGLHTGGITARRTSVAGGSTLLTLTNRQRDTGASGSSVEISETRTVTTTATHENFQAAGQRI